MKAQMMRVISSPSSSTTGFVTLIFDTGPPRGRTGRAYRFKTSAAEAAAGRTPAGTPRNRRRDGPQGGGGSLAIETSKGVLANAYLRQVLHRRRVGGAERLG